MAYPRSVAIGEPERVAEQRAELTRRLGVQERQTSYGIQRAYEEIPGEYTIAPAVGPLPILGLDRLSTPSDASLLGIYAECDMFQSSAACNPILWLNIDPTSGSGKIYPLMDWSGYGIAGSWTGTWATGPDIQARTNPYLVGGGTMVMFKRPASLSGDALIYVTAEAAVGTAKVRDLRLWALAF